MEISRIIVGIITGLIGILFGVYVSFTARKKGPIFTNTYIWYSKSEREKADINAEYKQVTAVFGGLSLYFLLQSLEMLFSLSWLQIPKLIIMAFILFYAIFSSIKIHGRQ